MIVASFSLPLEAVALHSTFEAVPSLQAEADRTAAESTEWVMPCLWATNAPFDVVDSALDTDPSVDTVVDEYAFQEEKLYQLKWSDGVIDRFDDMLDMEATILDASVDAGGWRMRIRFVSREQFAHFREYLAGRNLSFELLDITEPGAPREFVGDVTPDQRTALITANERGYFDVPRRTTLRELAEELDVSHQTLSEHIRRGVENLVGTTLVTERTTA